MDDPPTFAFLMKKIVAYLYDYFINIDKIIFISSTFFISVAIFINYYFGLNEALKELPPFTEFAGWYFIFLTAFSFAYLLAKFLNKDYFVISKQFIFLLLIAPALFAWKMAYPVQFFFTSDKNENTFWNLIIYWPFKLMVMVMVLYALWKLFHKDSPFYGCSAKKFTFQPYFIMLLIMIPLIAAASTQPDFLAMYPKLKNIEGIGNPGTNKKILYELSYGSDFFGIELFFRGFLVLAFARWASKDAILPMALFYCTIHFGKPLGECISSYFGGLILGVVTYHTQTIWGGLIVHLGIAWLMELGGYMGNAFI